MAILPIVVVKTERRFQQFRWQKVAKSLLDLALSSFS